MVPVSIHRGTRTLSQYNSSFHVNEIIGFHGKGSTLLDLEGDVQSYFLVQLASYSASGFPVHTPPRRYAYT
jgi:hypothetical protein